MRIEENVSFLEKLSKKEIYARIKSSKVFVFPSVVEGFGIVIIEAFACGKTVVAVKHRWNASSSLIKDRTTGLITNNNSGSFTAAVKTLLKDKKERKALGKNAQKEARDYEWKKQAEKLIQFYSSLLKPTR